MLTDILYSYPVNCVIFVMFICYGSQALASVGCNFEEGFCNWVQDETNAFNWLRISGGTPSWYTGPSSDHTTGDGYYIYIEADSRNNGDIARLKSPEQKPGAYCLDFWYSMYGLHIWALNVYIQSEDGNENVIISRKGNTGTSDWRNVVLGVNILTAFKIVIEGIRGVGYLGDIAIDDVSMAKGTCSDCDFDNGLCHWTQAKRDAFDWTLQQGPSSSPDTGPSSDHTSGNGSYIYIESNNNWREAVSWLFSPLQQAGKYCFSFWYHMYGEHVDRLRIGLLYVNGTVVERFRKTGNMGNNWIQGNIILKSTTNFLVFLEGRIKNAHYPYKGEIAVDDVMMVSCHDCDNPTPNNAVANSTNFEYGSVIEIKCNTGYRLVGQAHMLCQANGLWGSIRPACKLYDCGNKTLDNGQLSAPNGTTFGQTATHICNIGYTLVGDTTVTCTDSGWKSNAGTCKIEDADNDALIAVYVLVPVVVIILAVLSTVIYIRRRFPNCKKASESKHESRKNPVMAAANKTNNGLALESQNHINRAYEDRSLDGNDEYATISDQQNLNSNNIYHNIAGSDGIRTEYDAHNYDHTQNTAAHFVDESYSHISENKSGMKLETNYNTIMQPDSGNAHLRKQAQSDMKSYDLLTINNLKETAKHRNELEDGKESDYDHAHEGGIDPVTIDNDDYSHLNDVNIKQNYPASFGSGNDDEIEYSYTNAHSARKGKDVQKSKVGYEQKSIPASQYELQDTHIDDRHYFVLEAE